LLTFVAPSLRSGADRAARGPYQQKRPEQLLAPVGSSRAWSAAVSKGPAAATFKYPAVLNLPALGICHAAATGLQHSRAPMGP